MRTPPTTPPAVSKRSDPGTITQERKYEVITPLFGGGVEPATADPVTIIRGTGIRGQLRFWWRACRGGEFNGDLQAMKEAEEALWGAASSAARPRPSSVQIAVVIDAPGQPDHPFEVVAGNPGRDGRPRASVQPRSGWRDLAYAAFPLQPKQEEARPGMETRAVRKGVKFTLTITFPASQRAAVEAALWGWETCGGVGARTRRGFGALCCKAVDGTNVKLPPTSDAEMIIADGLKKHVVKGQWPENVPHLQTRWVVTAAETNTMAAWASLIHKLKEFRQKRNPGSEANRPGRSRWPEPDAIRHLTGQAAPAHQERLLPFDKFPRARFGLPIIFHFKDARQGDPADTTLQGDADHDRLASPLILRPLLCAGDKGVGLALILETLRVPPGGLSLQGAPNNPKVISKVTAEEAAQIKPLAGKIDILQAFLDTL